MTELIQNQLVNVINHQAIETADFKQAPTQNKQPSQQAALVVDHLGVEKLKSPSSFPVLADPHAPAGQVC